MHPGLVFCLRGPTVSWPGKPATNSCLLSCLVLAHMSACSCCLLEMQRASSWVPGLLVVVASGAKSAGNCCQVDL